MLVTVITPTYNRALLLPRLYESLRRQTNNNFEWIVVDDGSTDDSMQLFLGNEGLMASAKHISTDKEIWVGDFRNNDGKASPVLKYVRKDNGGKHTAVNVGVQLAKGDLTLILDSDDELPTTAISDILAKYDIIRDDDKVGGLCFYIAHRNGRVIGRPILNNILTDSLNIRYALKVKGDMCEVFKTSVLRDNPFPVIPDERFCPEALLLNRIALKYKLLLFREVVYFRDYLDGGLTDNIVGIRMKSPSASMLTYAELTECPVPFKARVKAAINFWRFWYCRTATSVVPRLAPIWHCLRPLGWAMHRRDKR